MKISVVIPCYNSEETILKCLKSVLNQSYKPSEIIVVDDGSIDKTEDEIRKFIEISDIPVVFYKQENNGPSTARNLGVALSSGNWIAFLDSDDYWDEEKIMLQVEFLINNPDVGLVGSGNLKSNNVEYISFNKLLNRNYFQTSAVLVKKDIITKYEFNQRQKYSEDYLCWLKICCDYKVAIIHPRSVFPISKNIAFGGNGLSSRLFDMEKWELQNYWWFYKKGKISILTLLKVSCYSILKFFRRIVIKVFYEK
ncbi:glycosyltransferase family 2 protein [Myroides odoratimimus]|uniref:glycosyltransferase family 2 protein n=1 Tax=Myroides odoratimimus TaxID=76832 RepID=UPI002577F183|nr:glycosyltransferase family 2 protein [Myroides odoratimimus]MDM1039133.1 glycosyltransferase family 2 protein [Myroides odoratimimus]MDM1053320.1 glycosyltransferase family 2 protein [Myroides odoratimimus]